MRTVGQCDERFDAMGCLPFAASTRCLMIGMSVNEKSRPKAAIRKRGKRRLFARQLFDVRQLDRLSGERVRAVAEELDAAVCHE